MKRPHQAITGIVLSGMLFILFFYAWKVSMVTEIIDARHIAAVEKSIEPGREKKESFHPEVITWKQATIPAWSPRDAHATVVFNNHIWLYGGLEGNGYEEYWEMPHKNDIWVSGDGAQWKLAATSSPWTGRRSLTIVEFQNKLWMLGGWEPERGYLSDVWVSKNGRDWTLAIERAPWKEREGQTLTVFDGKLWMMGGVNFAERRTFNDVWVSEDGIRWKETTKQAPWKKRYDHTVTAFKGKLWLIGGLPLGGEALQEIWTSEDGIQWTQSRNIPWKARHGHTALVFQGYLWIISGWNGEHGLNNVWYSKDGSKWNKTAAENIWGGREDHTSFVFQNKMWITGGMKDDWQWGNDVWFSESSELDG